MQPTSTSWDPRAWQEWITSLLYVKYGQREFQPVPDRHGGDFGIEGFSRDGCAYQCYVAAEPLSTKELYEKQRDKVTTDLRKFVDNVADLQCLLAPTIIDRWVLVVPRYESKQLLLHCSTKATEVRNLSLPHVSPTFAVQVCTDDAWQTERQILVKNGIGRVAFDASPPSPDEIDIWRDANSVAVSNLDAKAPHLASGSKLTGFKRGILSAYIQGQNDYDKIGSDLPELSATLLAVKSGVEQSLAVECSMATDGAGRTTFRDVKERLERQLESRAPSLSEGVRSRIVMEALSDWILRCPLYFDEMSDESD